MNASELRIGNYVLDPYGKVIRLTEVKSASMLRHITLTEEWLEKFGFEKTNWPRQFMRGVASWRFGYIEFTQYTDGGFAMAFDEGMASVEIKYVHQLQNLYFALTGEELQFKDQ